MLACLVTSVNLVAQDFSNKGTDFWLGYGYHVRFVTGGGGPVNAQEMVLYFATDVATNVRVEIPGLGWVRNYSIPANTIFTSDALPKAGAQDARLTSEGQFNRGIHVTADRPVVAYAHIYSGNVSGATLLFPTNTLGKEYFSMNYTQRSNEGSSNSFFFVVAADTGITTVEITPSAATLNRPAGVPFTVNLSQGEIFNVMGVVNGNNGNDLTGSRIRSISTNGVACKRIAVFSGSGKMFINCGGTQATSADNLFAQAFPQTAWGKRFLTAPTRNMPNNFFRIGVSNPSTVVRVNGVALTGLVNNFYYDLSSTSQPLLIEADNPIMVAQYITSAGSSGGTGTCGNRHPNGSGLGDPEMIYLSPVEQTIDRVIINSTGNFAIQDHAINIVIKSNATGSVRLDGAPVSGFITHPQDNQFSYAQIQVSAGQHIVTADSGFNAIAYGYGAAETYGYNAGTNIRDLFNFISPINPLNISSQNTACACTPFKLSVTYPFQPTSLFWDFRGFQSPNVTVNNPVHDSTYFISGRQVWRYTLPNFYTYCPAGNYPVRIRAGTSGADGCGNFQDRDDTIYVKEVPNADFSWINNGCVTDPVRFRDTTTLQAGVFSYRWNWDFGDGNTSTERYPTHTYAAPGTYTVRFSLITNVGCISTTRERTITVTNVPVANFNLSNPLCEARAVTLTDNSSASAPGVLTRWMWDYGDGTRDTLTTPTDRIRTYPVWGPRTITLKVATNSGCESPLFQRAVVINPNPVANFNFPANPVCLPYQSAAFTNTTAIADGSLSTVTYAWDFGNPGSGAANTSTLTNPSHLYGAVGAYPVRLTATSAAGCVDDTLRTFSNIFPKPIASFTAPTETCLNGVTTVSSTASGAGAGQIINNWFWNFADATPVATGQPFNKTYAAAGNYSITHWVTTNQGCVSDTASLPVVILPLPVASFTTANQFCSGSAIRFIDGSTPQAGTIVNWRWDMGDGTILNRNSAAPFDHTYANPGSYNVTLTVTTDKGCSNPTPFTRTLVVNRLPLPGFISPEVCLSDASAQFLDTSRAPAGATIASWLWDFGNPSSGALNTSTLQNPTHRYSAVGNYTATLTVTTNQGCTASIQQSFTVNGDIPVSGFAIVNTGNVCGYDSVSIRNTSTVNFGSVTRVLIYWDALGAPTVFDTDENPSPNKIYKHLYPRLTTNQTYTIRFVAFSGATCQDDFTRTITINAVPAVSFTAIPDICPDAAPYTIIQATETGSVLGTAVFSGPGISNPTTGVFNPALVGPGTYSIKYTYTSTAGCVDSARRSITVYPRGTVAFTPSAARCERQSVTFTPNTTAGAGTIAQYIWNLGDGNPPVTTANANPVSTQYATSGSVNVQLTTVSSNGCRVSLTQPVTINPIPRPAFTFPANTCLPEATVAFTNTTTIADGTTNAITYTWDFGVPGAPGNTSTQRNPSFTYTAMGTYPVRLTARSGAGCIRDTLITVNSIRQQPIADFRSDSVSLCVNQTVRFSDNSQGVSGAVSSWNWSFGTGAGSSNQQNPTAVTYNTAGTYSVRLEVQNVLGCRDTVTKSFVVHPYPVVNAGPDKVVLEGGEIRLAATASGNNLRFLWTPAQFLNAPATLNPLVVSPTTDMTYRLTVTGLGGCVSTDDVFVKLLKAPVIPNTFTPNEDGINDFWVIQYIESYPNARVQIFNRYGQQVFESRGYDQPWNGNYKGKPLPVGTYYYVIEPGSGRKPYTGYVTIIK